MKKIYFLLLLAMVVIQTNAQIIITGAMVQTADDASGGTEYIQLMATEDLTFGPSSPYCLIVSRIDNNRPNLIGWTSLTSYKFNFSENITVAKGEFFYVGGTRRALRTTNAGVSQGDFSTSKWARYKDYRTEPGDENNGVPQGEVKSNGNIGLMNNNRVNVIAVFNTKTINDETKPIDMVVTCNELNNPGIKEQGYYKNVGTVEDPIMKGYPLPDNDHYTSSKGTYLGQGNENTFFFDDTNATHSFQKFVGVYNEGTHTWTTPRTKVPVAIPAPASMPTPPVLLIETGTDVTTLPVVLSSNFTAKVQGGNAVLNWSTASEQNNARFDIYRSKANNGSFEKIGSIAGGGTSNQNQTYSYTDNHPEAGVNYYQLVQVDNDGNTNLLGNTFVNVGLKVSSLSVSASGGTTNLLVYTAKGGIGKAYLYNINGHRIGSQRINLAKGYTTITFPVQLQKNSVYVAGIETQTEHLKVKFLN